MTSLKTSIKTITYLSDIGCLEIQGASLVIYSLLNKTPDASPDSASNTSVIYTILSLLNLVKPVQTRRETHA